MANTDYDMIIREYNAQIVDLKEAKRTISVAIREAKKNKRLFKQYSPNKYAKVWNSVNVKLTLAYHSNYNLSVSNLAAQCKIAPQDATKIIKRVTSIAGASVTPNVIISRTKETYAPMLLRGKEHEAIVNWLQAALLEFELNGNAIGD